MIGYPDVRRDQYVHPYWTGRFRNFTSKPEKLFALLSAALLHIIGLFLLIASHSMPVSQPASVSTLALSPITSPDHRAAATKPLSPPPLPASQKRPIPEPVSMATTAQVDDVTEADSAQGCAPFEAVAKAIADDDSILSAMRAVPRAQRSVSEVIVLWNDGWSAAAASDSSPLAQVRAKILQTLRAFPSDCLAESVAGPRLIPIASPTDGTLFLAIGSGEWNWGQLFEQASQFNPSILPILTIQ